MDGRPDFHFRLSFRQNSGFKERILPLFDVFLVVLLLELLDLDGLQDEVFVLERVTLLAHVARHYVAQSVARELLHLQEFVICGVPLAFACVHSLSPARIPI